MMASCTVPLQLLLFCYGFYQIIRIKIDVVPLIAARRLYGGWNYMWPAADWHE
jgi:hypothetical protein